MGGRKEKERREESGRGERRGGFVTGGIGQTWA
jgi:hypothetical protein